ncbi:MAG: TPM domain-containing protein [Lachnospiraceae bacterium]|nr:TPM domain-containing protein [Lachnospiraceae bacterium]
MSRPSGRGMTEGSPSFRIVWRVLAFFGVMLSISGFPCYGQESAGYVNPDTGYQVVVEDRAELLDEGQCAELAEAMQEITAFGNAAFVTVSKNDRSAESFARSYYKDRFGTDSGTVFVIDLDQRKIWIHSDGAVYGVISSAHANTVADNVYRYASKGQYYECANEAFREILALLKGQRIAQPMKYISNALLAMILALLANFGLILCFSGLHKPGKDAVLANIQRKFQYRGLKAVCTHQTRIYDPVSAGGGYNNGGSRGSGGGSSKGSGGGGGHSF